jgi:hypothetical protein
MRKKLLFVHLYQTTTAIGRTQNREKRKIEKEYREKKRNMAAHASSAKIRSTAD